MESPWKSLDPWTPSVAMLCPSHWARAWLEATQLSQLSSWHLSGHSFLGFLLSLLSCREPDPCLTSVFPKGHGGVIPCPLWSCFL